MKTDLNSITSLQSGIYANPGRDGQVIYLQARHFDLDGRFDPGFKPDLPLEGKIQKHLLKPNDILFAVKGHRNFAVKYSLDIGPAVASSVFTVIRIRHPDQVIPEYLIWYLNQPQSQAYFQAQSQWSTLPSLNQKTLESLEIRLPSLTKQRSIVAFVALTQKEKALHKRLQSLRESRNQHLILQSIQ